MGHTLQSACLLIVARILVKHYLKWKHLFVIQLLSGVGLVLCCVFGRGNPAFIEGHWGVYVMDSLAAIWAAGLTWILLIKLPKKPKAREFSAEELGAAQSSVITESVFYANFGHLPKWLYLPFVITAGFLVYLTLFLFSLGAAFYVINPAHF